MNRTAIICCALLIVIFIVVMWRGESWGPDVFQSEVDLIRKSSLLDNIRAASPPEISRTVTQVCASWHIDSPSESWSAFCTSVKDPMKGAGYILKDATSDQLLFAKLLAGDSMTVQFSVAPEKIPLEISVVVLARPD